MKIIFMGTPQFAADILLNLINSEHEVVAVYTRAPTLSGRGMKRIVSHTQLVADAAPVASSIGTKRSVRAR